jgi:probable rRNA maturation factor
MIEFFYENDFRLSHAKQFVAWLEGVIAEENCELGEIDYVFCDDMYLLNLNKEFLKHDTLTDIITFDNSLGQQLHGEIYISTERVKENSEVYKTSFLEELSRVLVHGVLHLCGYKDKLEGEEIEMRAKENHYLQQLKLLSS